MLILIVGFLIFISTGFTLVDIKLDSINRVISFCFSLFKFVSTYIFFFFPCLVSSYFFYFFLLLLSSFALMVI